MGKHMALIVTVLITSALIASAFALQTIQKNIPGSGSIKGVGVGVYWDQQCTNATSAIEFGLLEAGSSKDFTIYLKNEGNTDLTLSMATNNWVPTEASDYMTFTWNREGEQISPDQVISGVMTLSVSPNIHDISTFSLTITITATG